MNEKNKRLFVKILSASTTFLVVFWVLLFFYGFLFERNNEIRKEESIGQIFTLDITEPKEKIKHEEPTKSELHQEIATTEPEIKLSPDGSIIEKSHHEDDHTQNNNIPDTVDDSQNKEVIITKKSKISIVITNLGKNKEWLDEVIKLPNNVTLGFILPSPNLKKYYDEAIKLGFDIVTNPALEPRERDPNKKYLLLKERSEEDNLKNFLWFSEKFPGSKGLYFTYEESLSLNNKAFEKTLDYIIKNNIILLLSRDSLGNDLANLSGNKNIIVSDIIIYGTESPESIELSLANLLFIAKNKEFAVATIFANLSNIHSITKWISSLNNSEVEIVPLSIIGR